MGNRKLAYLDQHLSGSLSVSRLARAASASRRTLETCFLHAFTHSPGEEIRARRMTLARELLRNTTLSVTQIAPQCGFPETTYFTTLFRRRHGMSPGASGQTHHDVSGHEGGWDGGGEVSEGAKGRLACGLWAQ